MSSIAVDQPVVTLINVFTVPREHQAELVERLVRATEETMRHLPGFVSANIHVGLDGTHVANYAQWRNEDDFKAMLRDDGARKHMDALREIDAKAEPGLGKYAATHQRSRRFERPERITKYLTMSGVYPGQHLTGAHAR